MKIKPNYNHSKFGMLFFNLCAKWTEFIVKHRVLYYLLSCTWGLLLTLVGCVVSLFLLLAKPFSKGNIRFNKYLWIYKIYAGPTYWGGFETGLMFVRDQKSSDYHIDPHEFGHTFQNTLFGPFQLFVSLASAIRYWYQEIRDKKGKENKPYDAIWFEDAATQCGRYAAQYIEEKRKK